MGGAAGALLGSQVGRGRGRDAAAATGAVVGAVAGDRVANPNSPNSTTGTVIGGVAGAILGNQVGSGAGRTAATAAGAIAGAMVGDRVASHGAPSSQPAQIQRCRTIETTRDVFKGYRVTYRYSGRDIVTTLPYDPGPTVKINVGVIGSGPDTPAQPHNPPAVSSTDTSHDSSGTHSGAYPGAWSGGGGHHH
ncbi:MAG: glycine zipper 2TM domain-containing protein [Betaproteobacteria bacterium]|nr:glycine zipper 2TM domain-containing protein [Betaproteobacteria bacterium]